MKSWELKVKLLLLTTESKIDAQTVFFYASEIAPRDMKWNAEALFDWTIQFTYLQYNEI